MSDLSTEPAPPRSPWLGPITVLIAVTLALSAVFLVVPAFDLWFSRQFYDPALGFPASRVPAFIWLRSLSETIVWIIAGVLLASVLLKLILPRRTSLVPVRTTLFLSATLALGPGLLVNGLLKSVWGRPRPVEVVDFGGDQPFVGAWHMSDFCGTNCSFVSGEASFGIWLMALAFVVPRRFRNPVLVATGILAFIFSMNRIAFGGHFLSDVLISWALTLLIIALAYRFIFVRPPAWLREEALEGALAGAGLGIRNLIRRRPLTFGTGAAAKDAVIPSVHEARAEIGPLHPDEPDIPEPPGDEGPDTHTAAGERLAAAPVVAAEDPAALGDSDAVPAPELRPEHGGANAEPGADIEWLAAADHIEPPIAAAGETAPPAAAPSAAEPAAEDSVAVAPPAELPAPPPSDAHLAPLATELGGSDALDEVPPPSPLPAIIPDDEKEKPA